MTNRKGWWSRLSPEEQERRREERRQWHRNRTPEQVAASRAKARATYEARFPHRPALYTQICAENAERQPCDRCGGEGRMMLAFDDDAQTVELLAWRCYPCRKGD